jgi:hypothetical protein
MEKITINRNTLTWLASEDTGRSSINLARFHFGLPMIKNDFAPHDDADRGRCLRFLSTLEDNVALHLLDRVSQYNEDWQKQVKLIKNSYLELKGK